MMQQHKKKFYIFYFLHFHYWYSHFVEDHLPDGKYDSLSHLLQAETKSVPKTNVVSERDFAQLDHLLHQKPNATTLCLEGMILFANNKNVQVA